MCGNILLHLPHFYIMTSLAGLVLMYIIYYLFIQLDKISNPLSRHSTYTPWWCLTLKLEFISIWKTSLFDFQQNFKVYSSLFGIHCIFCCRYRYRTVVEMKRDVLSCQGLCVYSIRKVFDVEIDKLPSLMLLSVSDMLGGNHLRLKLHGKLNYRAMDWYIFSRDFFFHIFIEKSYESVTLYQFQNKISTITYTTRRRRWQIWSRFEVVCSRFPTFITNEQANISFYGVKINLINSELTKRKRMRSVTSVYLQYNKYSHQTS
jgi:hypothetical protein